MGVRLVYVRLHRPVRIIRHRARYPTGEVPRSVFLLRLPRGSESPPAPRSLRGNERSSVTLLGLEIGVHAPHIPHMRMVEHVLIPELGTTRSCPVYPARRRSNLKRKP